MSDFAGICPFCGHAYTEGFMAYCDECSTVFCDGCAWTLPNEATVCPDCYDEYMAEEADEEQSA